MDRDELATFLRARREALAPGDVGLPPGARRRAPGLRREEVAALTGMSTDYYARMEQGRGPQPSTQMLAALARTLRLTDDGRDYLFRAAGHPAPDRTSTSSHVAPALLRVLDRLSDSPALILSELCEPLAANHMAVALFGDVLSRTGMARSDIYRWFTEPASREIYPVDDHDRQGRALVSSLRVAYGRTGAASRAGVLVGALLRESAEFAGLWAKHEVARRFADHKTLLHPEIGPIELDCQALFTEDQTQSLLVLTAAPENPDARARLDLLRVVGSHVFEG